MTETARSSDGTDIGFSRSGTGPVLILVHGTTSDRLRWHAVLPALEAHFTVLAVDRRGRGASGDAVESPYSIDQEIEDVLAVVRASGSESVGILAHSFGAVCALEAATQSAKIRSLVLYEPPLRIGDAAQADNGTVDGLFMHLRRGDNEAALVSFYTDVLKLPAPALNHLRSLPNWPDRVKIAHTVARELAAVAHHTVAASTLGQLDIPVLLVQGGASLERFVATTDYLQQHLPQAERVLIPGQGHAALDNAPEAFTQAVLPFLIAHVGR